MPFDDDPEGIDMPMTGTVDLLKTKLIDATVRELEPYFLCAGCQQFFSDIRQHLNDQRIEHVRRCRYAYRKKWDEDV